MSLTVTVLAQTPDMRRLLAVSTDPESGASGSLTQAALAALCAHGPLKSMISAPLFNEAPGPGASSWALMAEDGRLSVYVAAIGTGSAAVGQYAFVAGTPNLFSMSTSSGGQVVFELNFRHSINR